MVEPPTDAPVQIGPMTLAPMIALTNFGHDSNVFNRNITDGPSPQGDFTSTVSPAVDGWLRSPHVRMNGHSQFDYYYFKDLSQLRALDTNSTVQVEFPLNRLTPIFGGHLTSTRQPQNLEIDAIARRRDEGITYGLSWQATPTFAVEVYQERSRVDYDLNSLYLGTDLARTLNHHAVGEGVVARYTLTPFTTLAVDVKEERDRFDFAVDSNADSVVVTPSIEFSPWALISGRASVGFQRRKFLSGVEPDFNGTTAQLNLSYTLLGQTRFTVDLRRQLDYSYLLQVHDYLDTDLTVSGTQRFGESWDATGSIGRARLNYNLTAPPPAGPGAVAIPATPDETIDTSAIDVGYRIGKTRTGFRLEYRTRTTDAPVPFRSYDRFRYGATLTYVF